MKIPSDILKPAGRPFEDDRIRQQPVPEAAGSASDSLRLAREKISRVTDENRMASKTDLLDFKKAEYAVSSLKQRLLQDRDTAAALHRFGDRQVLFLLID